MLFKCMYFWHRFQKSDLDRLRLAPNLPEKYVCGQGTTAAGMEGLLVLLRRLSYLNRWCDLVIFFGRSESELGNIFKMVMYIHNYAV